MPNRRFGAIIFGQAISQTGTWLQFTILPLWIYEITGSTATTGLVFALELLPVALVLPFLGPAIDRLPKKLTLALNDALNGLLVVTLLFALMSHHIVTIILLIALSRSLLGVTLPIVRAWIPELVPAESRAQANGRLEGVAGVSLIAGPVLAALLLATTSYQVSMVANAVSFWISAACTLLVRPQTPSASDGRQVQVSTGYLENLRLGFGTISHQPRLRRVFASEGCLFAIFGASPTLTMVFLASHRGDIGIPVGVVLAGVGVGALAAARVFALRKTFQSPSSAFALVGAFAAIGALLIVVPRGLFGYPLILLGAVLLGASSVLLVAPLSLFYQESVDRARLGRVMTLRRSANAWGQIVSIVVWSLLGGLLGSGPALVLAGATTLLCGATLAVRQRTALAT